ncbi:MAG TPA: hypothetical protein VHB98_00810, partial [Chloroflexota bacterium]|nr:hypothetical protein [Chloroflexota bacterium]
TPAQGQRGYEDPGIPAGGAWALATYSLSCNVPTYYITEHAPGDEGGIDSADGVVNVHLPMTADNPHLCVGFTGQVTPPVLGGVALSQTYAIAGSTPLPAGTVITLHFDRDALLSSGGATLAILRRSLSPNPTGAPGVCLVSRGLRADLGDGTASAVLNAATTGSAAYQVTLLPSGAVGQLPQC